MFLMESRAGGCSPLTTVSSVWPFLVSQGLASDPSWPPIHTLSLGFVLTGFVHSLIAPVNIPYLSFVFLNVSLEPRVSQSPKQAFQFTAVFAC